MIIFKRFSIKVKFDWFLFFLILVISLATYIVTVAFFVYIEKTSLSTVLSHLSDVDLKRIIELTQKKNFILFLLLSPIPFTTAFVISRVATKNIKQVFEQLDKYIASIKGLEDLSKIELVKTKDVIRYYDISELFDNFNNFIEKIKGMAVDKNILEFQIKIIEKFLITSDVIKDWKKHVSSLLKDINTVMEIRVVFSLFKLSDDELHMEFFWAVQPSEDLKNKVVELAEEKCRSFYQKYTDFKAISISHTVIPSDRCDILDKNFTFETKTLLLDNPNIGGIVSIGINSRDSNTLKRLVVEGLLTTFVNVIGSVKAISKYNQELEYYATRDNITNLFNYQVFRELLNYEVSRAQSYKDKFSILIVNLDNFKYINENFGHDAGDSFLKEISELIQKSVRPIDIVARYSGDEFTVIMPEATAEDAHMAAERIIKMIEKFQYIYDDKSINTTASIGFATYPDHGLDPKELFAFADNMLFKAKSEGKNRVLIPTKEDIIYVKNITSEKSYMIVRAIEENRIIPFFQPIMNISTNEIEKYEVLCRVDMGYRIVSASEFIEIAERTGNVIKIDFLMIENSLKKLMETQDNISLFINLSPKTLIIPEFIQKIINITNSYNIRPENLVFEITERDTVRNIQLLEKFIVNLKSYGYKFAIDDFGSGFSSYEYLKRFPVDFVKIDGDFIKNITINRKDLAIVRSLLVITEEFNVKTIAEYVEDQATLELLKELRVDYAQGYLIGKPEKDFVKR